MLYLYYYTTTWPDLILENSLKNRCNYNWARICKPFKEPENRFRAWRADTTTLFVVQARYAT